MTTASAGAPRRAGQSWERFLWLPAAVSFFLLVLPQATFIWTSFHEDLGLGMVSDALSIRSYVTILVDPFYLLACGRTVALSAAATFLTLVFAFPTAYALARMGRLIATLLLSLILTTSLITDIIKLMGLTFILGPSGLINELLQALGCIDSPLTLLNNQIGVLIGLVQYTLPVVTLILFGVAQTIPIHLEEAAESLGARRFTLFLWVIMPLARQGLISSGLIAFNMAMGAFTSAVLLGGGRVLTMPVLIQQKIIQSTEYGMGAALSTVLLLLVFLINIVVGAVVPRGRKRSAASTSVVAA
jgi:putative spermidine/putrescine transport system permease protein